MPCYNRDRWVNICPYPGNKDIRPIPPPITHLSCVKDMAKNRKPLVDANRRGT